jgi:hypothetical protein
MGARIGITGVKCPDPGRSDKHRRSRLQLPDDPSEPWLDVYDMPTGARC